MRILAKSATLPLVTQFQFFPTLRFQSTGAGAFAAASVVATAALSPPASEVSRLRNVACVLFSAASSASGAMWPAATGVPGALRSRASQRRRRPSARVARRRTRRRRPHAFPSIARPAWRTARPARVGGRGEQTAFRRANGRRRRRRREGAVDGAVPKRGECELRCGDGGSGDQGAGASFGGGFHLSLHGLRLAPNCFK